MTAYQKNLSLQLLAITASLFVPLLAVAAPPRRDAQRLQNQINRESRDRLRRHEEKEEHQKLQQERKDREQRDLQDKARREAQDRARQESATDYAKLLANPIAPKGAAPKPKSELRP